MIRLLALAILFCPSLALAQTCYMRPLNSRITQAYGHNGHQGVDFAASVGTHIPSAADGVVVLTIGPGSSQEHLCHGRVVVVRHPDGKNTAYAHLNAIHVSVGQHVSRGQWIADSGQTGSCALGPHLHLGMSPASDVYGYRDGNNQDPLAYIDSHRVCRPDADGDGSYEGDDCDDHDAHRFPGNQESCDDVDNDCDDRIDENVTRTCGTDVGACHAGSQTCTTGAWGECVGEVAAEAEWCDAADDDCDGMIDEARVCEHDDALASALDRSRTDVNGDGRADPCIRTPAGFVCLASAAYGFADVLRGPDMADENGWSDREVYTSVRMGDVDGDGLDDLCARDGERLVCWRATGHGFGESLVTLPLPDPSPGADGAEVWLADVDGDAHLDLCARGVEGLLCATSTHETWALHALSDEAGFDDVARHGSIRFGDVDGDATDDVCARLADGMQCWLGDGTRLGARVIRGPAWTDALGWSDARYGSTIRLADVDGDRLADVCGRGPDGFTCRLSTGNGFGAPQIGPPTDGWDERSVYATLALGDVDGDGARDLCARLPTGVRCWLWGAHGFDRAIVGPALTDDEGWNSAERYTTMRLADVNDDGHADVCARAGDGLRCWLSNGMGFSEQWLASSWSDAVGLGDPAFATTLGIGGVGHGSAPSSNVTGSCACRAQPRATTPWCLSLLGLIAIVVLRQRPRRALGS